MTITAKIRLDSDFSAKFNRDTTKEISKKIEMRSLSIQEKIANNIRQAVRDALTMAPEYREITGGVLRSELGIPDSSSRIAFVVDAWINGIFVRTKAGKSPFLSIEIGMLQSDYGDVLSLPAAHYTYHSNKFGTVTIPWLKWLLIEGDRRIVANYEIAPNAARSRTGTVIMVRRERSAWQVPAQFSGTAANNFATRALEGMDKIIDHIVEKAIRGSLK